MATMASVDMGIMLSTEDKSQDIRLRCLFVGLWNVILAVRLGRLVE